MFDIPPDLRGMNVLVVDDCADSRHIMAKILTSLDLQVETLASGIDALQRLQGLQRREETGGPGADGLEDGRDGWHRDITERSVKSCISPCRSS